MDSTHPSKSDIDRLLSFADPRIAAFLNAWRDARHGALVPYKHDFDPLSVPSLLRYVWLYRYDSEIGDFICLLAGENVNTAWGRSIKNARLRDVVGAADHPTVLKRWKEIVGRPAAIHGAKDERLTAHETWRAERMILPLRSDTDEADHVIGLSLYRLALPDEQRQPLISEDITMIPCENL